MSKRYVVLSTLALLGCAGGGAQESSDGDALQPVAVRAVAVTDTMLARPIVATGTVAPRDEVTLSFKIGGVIARIGVDAGDRVRARQTLASLDLGEIDAAVAKARSAHAKAERDLARVRRLHADSVASLSQLEDAQTALDVARADLQAAEVNRRYAVIVAPSAGIVLRRNAEPGETVAPGTPVLAVGSAARGNVIAVGLADRDAVAVRRGDPAVVRFDAFPGRTFVGEVTQVGGAADRATGTYPVEISLRGANGLTAGLVGQVEIRPGRGMNTTLVPVEAVLEAEGNDATVFVLSDDGAKASRRRVKVAFIAGSHVAIAAGLEGVRTVLTDGAAYLDDGSAVRVTP